MKRLLALAVVSVTLPGGCVAADDARLNTQHVPVYIDRPVACLKASEKPLLPGALPARPSDARKGEAVLLAKVHEWEGYGDHADPLLEACTKKP